MNPKDLVGAKKAPLRYVPPAGAIESSGPHEDGAIKYGPFNWRETPVEMVTYLEAIDRHLAALKDGQDFAEDSGYSHIGHIIAGANIIADAKAHGTLIDNRFTRGPAADMLRARDKSDKPPTSILPAVFVDELEKVGPTRFLCGHYFGDEPITDPEAGPLCGTQLHWSPKDGIAMTEDGAL